MIGGKWTEADDRRQMNGGKWTEADGRRQMEGGRWTEADDRRQMDGGKWTEADGRRQTDGGKWTEADGRRQMDGGRCTEADGDSSYKAVLAVSLSVCTLHAAKTLINSWNLFRGAGGSECVDSTSITLRHRVSFAHTGMDYDCIQSMWSRTAS
jgi:hypothetical protein